jgi:hypothetical protein
MRTVASQRSFEDSSLDRAPIIILKKKTTQSRRHILLVTDANIVLRAGTEIDEAC